MNMCRESKRYTMKYSKTIFGLGAFTAVATSLYWILYFIGVMPVDEIVPGYITWFESFPIADLWIVVTSALLAFAMKTKRDNMAVVCGLLTASGMIFLALNELGFSINTGMILMPLSVTGFDFALKIYCLFVGTFFIKQFSCYIKETCK